MLVCIMSRRDGRSEKYRVPLVFELMQRRAGRCGRQMRSYEADLYLALFYILVEHFHIFDTDSIKEY